jgi:hypothetical protein
MCILPVGCTPENTTSKSLTTVLELSSEFTRQALDDVACEDDGEFADLRGVARRSLSSRARPAMPSKMTANRNSARTVWNGTICYVRGVLRLA